MQKQLDISTDHEDDDDHGDEIYIWNSKETY